VKLKVLYFASLREQLGTGSEEIEMAGESASLAALRARLGARGGNWQTALAEGRSVRMAINQDMVPGSQVQTALLKSGDEIAFFPPVTGG
jgi:molybdopterin synthase sulfur carrier subunit